MTGTRNGKKEKVIDYQWYKAFGCGLSYDPQSWNLIFITQAPQVNETECGFPVAAPSTLCNTGDDYFKNMVCS